MNSTNNIATANEPASTLIDQVVHSAESALHTAEQAAHGAASGVVDGTRRVRESARAASDSAARYIQTEPVKAVLIAAASGAALMALLMLARRA